MSYYNTTQVKGQQKVQYQSKAKRQEAIIGQFFKMYPTHLFTPSEVQAGARYYFLGQPPITSIRRAITNLTTAGVLVKTATQKKGPYDRPEYCWRYNAVIRSGDDLINQLCGRN